jgi:hypothetical protein
MNNFIVATIRNNKTEEEIMVVVRNDEQVKRNTAQYLNTFPKVQIKPMLKKYIATTEALSESERLEAFYLSACFLTQSKLFQDSGNITIGWTFHEDIESLAKWQQEYHQVMTSNGGNLMLREAAL